MEPSQNHSTQYLSNISGKHEIKELQKTATLGTAHLLREVQGGSNMTGTDLYVNKPHCAAAVRP